MKKADIKKLTSEAVVEALRQWKEQMEDAGFVATVELLLEDIDDYRMDEDDDSHYDNLKPSDDIFDHSTEDNA